MIKDNLKNAMQYACLSERFKKAFEYLTSSDLLAVTERVELEGKDLYVLPQNPTLKTWDAARWEAHEKYADIQIVLEGEEVMGYAPIETLAAADEYNPEKDAIHLTGEGAAIRFTAGDFAVYFPQDGHKPNVRAEGGAESDRKMVVKVKL